MGNSLLEKELNELGLETWSPAPNFVAFKYVIPHGRFKGQQVDIALQAPSYPLVPPSGLHIKPFLMPITGGGGQHPEGGIHSRNKPTPDFQYWSRPFNLWNQSEKNAKAYLSFIRMLFDFE